MTRRILHIRADGSAEHPISGSVRVMNTYITTTESPGLEHYLLIACSTKELADKWLQFFNLPEDRICIIQGFSPLTMLEKRLWGTSAAFIREKSIDFIHSHGYKADVIAVILGFLTKRKTISTVHGYNPASRRLKSKIIWALYRNIWLLFDHVILVSSSMLEIPLFRRLEKLSKVTVIENFIEPIEIEPQIIKDDQSFTILSIGRLSYEKNHLLLCKAVEKIAVAHPIRCIIVGDGVERTRLTKYISENKLDGVIQLTGFRQDIARFYQQADVFVLPSQFEGLPIVLLEAMSIHCPIIAANVGKIPALLGVDRGWLFESGNVEDLTAKILHVIENRRELNRRAENAYHYFMERYSLGINAQKLVAMYHSLS